MRKQIIWTIIALLLVAVASSGWIYNTVRSNSDTKEKELATLMSAFNQQYGTDGITVKQMISPEKVYVAVWTDKDGASHVSWNIGGLWVTVWNSEIPAVSTPVP